MLALCMMLSNTYYAQQYAGIIGLGLGRPSCATIECYTINNVKITSRSLEAFGKE